MIEITDTYEDAIEGPVIVGDRLTSRLAAFASETGRTAMEWLDAWNSGQIARTDAATGRYEQAAELAAEWDAARAEEIAE